MSKAKFGLLVAGFAIGASASLPSFAQEDKTEPVCVALVRGFWIDVFEKRDAEIANKYLSPHYIQHSPPPQPSIKEWVQTWKGVFATPPSGPGADFPEAQKDYQTEIVSLVGDDQMALIRAHDTGHWDHGPKKGQAFVSDYYDMFRCHGDKIIEHWFAKREK